MGTTLKIPCSRYDSECNIKNRDDGRDCRGIIYKEVGSGDSVYFCLDNKKGTGDFRCEVTETLELSYLQTKALEGRLE